MTWKIDDPQGNEAFKIRWELIKWTRGRGLDIGCGPGKTYAHFIGVDNKSDSRLFNIPINPDITVDTAERMELFASSSMDFCLSSHLLEHLEYERVAGALKEWMRLIKTRGYLVLYLPDEDEYPKVATHGANPDHKWNVNYDKIIECMRETGTSWDLVDFQKRNQDDEYSLFFVFQKVGSGQHFSWRKERPKRTCAVVRYGAFGDLLQASSVIAGLKQQGYHVTLYTSPPGDEVIKFDPNIDDFYLQDKDQVPNAMLAEFWDYHRPKYDKWVQLSESVEGSLLAIPGRAQHGWPPALRHSCLNRNYLEFQHEIAEVPHKPRVHFYPTEEEKLWAQKERRKLGDFVIGWSVNGSSVHKTWGGLDNIIAAILMEFQDTHFVLLGGPQGKVLEQGWENEKRVHRRCGQWSIRQSLSFMQHVDLAIGPETGVMNACAMLPYPKVIFLSHSTDENLTRDWVNTHVLASEDTTCPGRGHNDAPACHQLHYQWKHCKQTEDGLAQCQADISVDRAHRVIWHAIVSERERRGLSVPKVA